MTSLRLIPPIAALVLAACASPPDTLAPADSPVARGQLIASSKCGSCHAVGRFDHSRHAGAPEFRKLSELYPIEGLEESLVEGLMTGHPDMPEFTFNTQAANDFVAYLESIQITPQSRPEDRAD